MGGESLFRRDRVVKATNTRTKKVVELVVWAAGNWPRIEEHVSPEGGGQLVRLGQGRYQDYEGTEYVSTDPHAP